MQNELFERSSRLGVVDLQFQKVYDKLAIMGRGLFESGRFPPITFLAEQRNRSPLKVQFEGSNSFTNELKQSEGRLKNATSGPYSSYMHQVQIEALNGVYSINPADKQTFFANIEKEQRELKRIVSERTIGADSVLPEQIDRWVAATAVWFQVDGRWANKTPDRLLAGFNPGAQEQARKVRAQTAQELLLKYRGAQAQGGEQQTDQQQIEQLIEDIVSQVGSEHVNQPKLQQMLGQYVSGHAIAHPHAA